MIQDRRTAKTPPAGHVFYKDGESFARIYTDHEKAAGFAERQRKSPVVKMARVTQIS